MPCGGGEGKTRGGVERAAVTTDSSPRELETGSGDAGARVPKCRWPAQEALPTSRVPYSAVHCPGGSVRTRHGMDIHGIFWPATGQDWSAPRDREFRSWWWCDGMPVVVFVAERLPPSRFGAAVATCKEPGAGKPWSGRLHARCGVVSCPICRIEPDARFLVFSRRGGCQLTRGADEGKRREKNAKVYARWRRQCSRPHCNSTTHRPASSGFLDETKEKKPHMRLVIKLRQSDSTSHHQPTQPPFFGPQLRSMNASRQFGLGRIRVVG